MIAVLRPGSPAAPPRALLPAILCVLLLCGIEPATAQDANAGETAETSAEGAPPIGGASELGGDPTDLSDPISDLDGDNPAAELGAAAAPDLEKPLVRPPNKPVSEMTPEERKAFRRWRRARLAEMAPPELSDEVPDDAVTFDLSFPESQGGGSAEGWAGAINYRQDEMAELSGGVLIRYQEIEIRADRIDVDLESKLVKAYGDVILDQGPQRLSGTTLTYDLRDKTGTVSNARAFMSPDFYFTGAEVRKTGEQTYEVEDGVFTSCRGDNPDWSFALGRATIEVDGYARVRNAAMRIKKAPVLYLPYLLWPVKSGRVSGFLVPNVGYSERRGGHLGLAYYQVLGESYDTTFFADLYSESFLGLGNEIRYRPSDGTEGRFEGYAIRDPEPVEGDEWRWKIELDHETRDLPWGMRGVVSVREYSDFTFFRDFERSVDKNTVRTLESRGFASGNWGVHSLNVLFNRRETFISQDNTVTLAQLPEIEYRLRPLKLGSTPLLLQMQSSLSYLSVDRSEAIDGTYGRADLAPQLTLPLRLVPWLGISVSAGHRLTWYGDSLTTPPAAPQPTDPMDPTDPTEPMDPADPFVSTFSGDSLTRSFSFASAEVVGPSFSRIFDLEKGAFSKLKHVIEPRFTYAYSGDVDELDEIPTFDEIDRLSGVDLARISLTNRVLAKERVEEEEEDGGGGGSAREILSWELARLVSLDDERPLQSSADGLRSTSVGPLSSLLRYNPSSVTSLTARFDYNTLFSQLTSSSISGAIGFGSSRLGLSWRTNWNAETGMRQTDQIRLSGGFQLIPRRLGLQTDVVYDVEGSEIQQQRYILDYRSQCYSLRFEVRDINRLEGRDFADQDFRFSVNLKNVGTFLDLTN